MTGTPLRLAFSSDYKNVRCFVGVHGAVIWVLFDEAALFQGGLLAALPYHPGLFS